MSIPAEALQVQNKTKLVFRRWTTSGPVVTTKLPSTFLVGVSTQNATFQVSVDTGVPQTTQVIDVRSAIPNRQPAFRSFDNTLYPVLPGDGSTEGYPYIVDQGVKYQLYDPSLAENRSQGQVDAFTFYVNPQHLAPNYRKARTQIKTLGGWEIQHWGNELTEIQVRGTSGGMHRMNEGGVNRGLLPTETIRDSTAWKKLEQLRQIYINDHALRNIKEVTLWGLNYQGRTYIGTFSSLTGPEEDSMMPFQFTYAFTFIVEQEKPGLADIANMPTGL